MSENTPSRQASAAQTAPEAAAAHAAPSTAEQHPQAASASLEKASGFPLFAPLRTRDFRFLWAGEGVSILGTQFHLVALPWLVLGLTSSTVALGTVLMAAAIPRALFMLGGGALTDHFSPRRMMLISNAGRGVLSATLAALIATHQVRLWHVYAIPALFGAFDAMFYPAYQSMLPRLLPPGRLRAGNALMQGTIQSAMLIGPAPAGALIAAASLAWAFGIDSLSFAVAVVMLLMIATQASAVAPGERKNVLHSIAEGAQYLNRDRAMRAFMLLGAVINLTVTGPFMVGLPVLARDRFSGALAYGLMFSAFGGGALAGGITAGSMKHVPRPGIFMIYLMLAIGAGMVGLGFLPRLLAVCAVMAAMGLGVGIANITNITWIQHRSEPHVLGRVMSLMMLAGVGLVPFSMAIAGFVAKLGTRTLFSASGAAVFSAALWAATVRPLREIK